MMFFGGREDKILPLLRFFFKPFRLPTIAVEDAHCLCESLNGKTVHCGLLTMGSGGPADQTIEIVITTYSKYIT